MKRLMTGLILTAVAALAGCATTPSGEAAETPAAREAALQCGIMVDLARQIEAGNVDPMVGETDCRQAFADAGLSMRPVGRPDAPPSGDNIQTKVRFNPAQITGDTAVVAVDFVCLRLCGHGERITLRGQGRSWKVVMRETTWIS